MRFFVLCKGYREEVIGEPVEIQEAPGEMFAVHRSCIDSPSNFPFWSVSHVETGLQIGCGDTIDFAIQIARDGFAKKTSEQIASAFTKARATHAREVGNPVRTGEHFRSYADDDYSDSGWICREAL